MPPGGHGAIALPPISISAGDAWGFGWRVVSKKFGAVALPLAVAFFVEAFLANIVSTGGSVFLGIAAEQGLLDASILSIANLAVSLVGGIVSLLVSAFMTGGIVLTGLKAARGQPVTFGDPFSGGRFFGPMFVAMIANAIVVLIGSLLCLIPGLILTFGLALYPALVVDQGLSGIDALKKSWEMTKGHKMTIFVVGLIGLFVFLAGGLACGIGMLLVSFPMAVVAGSWLYLRIKGDPIAEPA
ncbi:MAG TPA: hypothetical protein VGK73_18295 [Polyangiaceae bacterium]